MLSGFLKSLRQTAGPVLLLVLLLGAAARADTPPLGQPAPPLQVLDLKSGQAASLAPYAGKVIVLAFLDPTCEFCKAEAPYLQRRWGKYRKKNVAVVGVMMSVGTSPVTLARKFAVQHHFTFPVLMDTPQNTGERSWGIWAHPFNGVIDQHGVLRYLTPGYEGTKIDNLVRQLLASP